MRRPVAIRTSRKWRQFAKSVRFPSTFRGSLAKPLFRITWSITRSDGSRQPMPERIAEAILHDPPPGSDFFFTRSRSLANWFRRYVQTFPGELGGYFGIEEITAVRCRLCHRWLFGVDATVHEELNRKAGKPQPCGHACVRIPLEFYRKAMKAA